MDVVAEVDGELIAEVLATATGIPVFKLTEEESSRLLRMEDELHKRVIGQKDAIKALSRPSGAPVRASRTPSVRADRSSSPAPRVSVRRAVQDARRVPLR
ncbi:hypothetical protein GCM10020221_01560 [Streptomyces thioluteus]|uniref:Uncharacterized protein n=2 Tax=Streptomyces thioluteus TaxID=66431 RepID=A0ABN3WD64_STRTU